MMLRRAGRLAIAAAALLSCAAAPAAGPEAVIRKALMERVPHMPKIDEIRRSPVAGLWEVRFNGTEILYADDKGNHIFINGSLIDTRTQVDLTEARIEKAMSVDFSRLPAKDAIAIKQGSGSRRLAVFVDPHCGYCKRFERDLAGIEDVTVYTYLTPILGPASASRSRDIWCAKDPAKAWRAWMIDGVPPPRSDAGCDTAAIDRNLAFAQAQRITGTPALFFEDGTRKTGAPSAEAVERSLATAGSRR